MFSRIANTMHMCQIPYCDQNNASMQLYSPNSQPNLNYIVFYIYFRSGGRHVDFVNFLTSDSVSGRNIEFGVLENLDLAVGISFTSQLQPKS